MRARTTTPPLRSRTGMISIAPRQACNPGRVWAVACEASTLLGLLLPLQGEEVGMRESLRECRVCGCAPPPPPPPPPRGGGGRAPRAPPPPSPPRREGVL